MTPPTIEAVNRYNRVVFTFNAIDLATDYRDRMALIGCPITLRIARVQRRAAA